MKFHDPILKALEIVRNALFEERTSSRSQLLHNIMLTTLDILMRERLRYIRKYGHHFDDDCYGLDKIKSVDFTLK